MASEHSGGGGDFDWDEADDDEAMGRLVALTSDEEDEGDPGDWQEYDVGGGDVDQAAGYQLASQDDASVCDADAMGREDSYPHASSPPFPCTDDQSTGLHSVCSDPLFSLNQESGHPSSVEPVPFVPSTARKRRRVAEVHQGGSGESHMYAERPVEQEGTVFTYREKWNLVEAASVLASLPVGHHDTPVLRKVLSDADDDGFVTVRYKYAEGLDHGRVYATKSYQNVTVNTRRRCARDTYMDLDIVNCFPVLLLQVMERHGVECRELSNYVANRAAIIESICTTNTSMTKDMVKLAFIIGLHCGDYRKYDSNGTVIPELDSFTRSIRRAVADLSVTVEYRSLYQSVLLNRNKKNKLGTFAGYVAQNAEAEVIKSLCEYVHSIGGTVATNMFDGVFIDRMEIDLTSASAFIFERSAFQVTIIEKPMLVGVPLVPIDDNMVVFDLASVPSQERINDIRAKGIKVGLVTDGKAVSGVEVDVLFDWDKTYAPRRDYVLQNPTMTPKTRMLHMSYLCPNAVMITDNPARVPPADRFRVSPSSAMDQIIQDAVLVAPMTCHGWKRGVSVVEHGTEVEWVQAYIFEGIRCLLVKAGMGMGKTKQTTDAIEKYNFKRICAISTRVAFSRSLQSAFKRLHFVHYADGDLKADRIIIQYESLWRLENTNPFDMIIVDEVRSVCDNMVCEQTNKVHLRTNAGVLKAICRASTITLGLDADLESDAVVPIVYQRIFKPSEIRVERYLAHKMKKTVRLTKSESGWIDQIRECLDSGEKSTLCCRTKKRAKVFAELLKEFNPKVYTSDSDDATIKDFHDINAALLNVQLCIMTSKVTVGADHTDRWGRVFVDTVGNMGACPRLMLQMVGRFRNTDSNEVLTLISTTSSPDEVEGLVELEKQQLIDRKDAYRAYHPLIRIKPAYANGVLTLTPDWYTEVKSITLAEAKQSVEFDLRRLCGLKGFEVIDAVVDEDVVKCNDMKAAAATVKETIESFDRTVFDALMTTSIDECIREFEPLVANQTATYQIKSLLAGAYVVKHWPTGTLAYEEYAFACKNMKPIIAIANLLKFTMDDCIESDGNRLSKAVWQDQTVKLIGAVRGHLSVCVCMLGFTSLLDTTTIVPESTFDSNAEAVLKACAQSAAVRGVRKWRGKKATGALRAELKAVYGINLSRSSVGHRRSDNNYKLEIDDQMRDLADRSDFFSRKPVVRTSPTVDFGDGILPV